MNIILLISLKKIKFDNFLRVYPTFPAVWKVLTDEAPDPLCTHSKLEKNSSTVCTSLGIMADQ